MMKDELLELDEDYGLESPISIYDTIPKFENGQVYKVLKKNTVGDFIAFKQNKIKDQVLICIMSQDTIFNDQPQTLTFFKDITFGVVYR